MSQGVLHRMEIFLLGLLGVALCLDVPSARAFNETDTWTKDLGQYLFHGFKELYGLPLPFTLFELLAYASLAIVLLLWGWQRGKSWRALVFASFLVPAAGLWAFTNGVVQGHDLGLASTQLHFIPLLAVWLLLGFFMGLRPSNGQRIFRVLFWSGLFKSGLALGVFVFAYDLDMGSREYLIDHASSIYIVSGMIYGVWQLLRVDCSLKKKTFFLFALLIMGTAYLLNDRRASYAGLLIALMLLPLILPRTLRRDVWPLYKLAGALGLIILGAFVIDANNPYSFSGGLKSELFSGETLNLSYRHLENFNLLSGVAEAPLLGLGFGQNYPQVLELPDITATFSLFASIPHNTLFYLWAFAGPLGMAGFATLAWMVLLLITRCGAWSRNSAQLFYAVLALVVTTQWMLFVFFDMGLLEGRSLMVFGLVVGGLYPQYARHIKEYFNENLA